MTATEVSAKAFVQWDGREPRTALSLLSGWTNMLLLLHCDGGGPTRATCHSRFEIRQGERMRQVVCLLALFSLLALSGAMAQTGVDGAILGVVSDANGGVIAGATVTVTKLDTGVQRTETSRSDGSFEISALRS